MKTKKTLKSLLVMAVCLLMLVALVGCGEEPASSQSGDPASNPASSQGGSDEFNLPGNYDFGGDELLIKCFGGYGFQKPGTSEIGDVEIRWKAAVEKAYNCTVEMEALIPNNTQDSLVVRILSGDKVADLIACHRLDVEKMRVSGNLLTDLASLKNLGLDLTDPGWNAQLTDALTYNGKVYGTYPVRADIESAMFFNKDMIEQLGLESPYKYVADGQWTYDKFIEYCQAATKNGVYGVALDGDALLTMYHNNGMQLISKQPDGKMKYTGYSQQNVDTISYLKEKLVAAKLTPEFMDSVVDYHTMFKEGKLLFMTGPDSYLVSEAQWGSCDFEVGFLPVPTAPGHDYSFLLCQWPPCFCITSTNDTPERGVALMNAYLACEKVTNPLREDNYENNWFGNDPDGYEVFKMLKDKAYYDWAIYDLGFYDLMYGPQQVFRFAEMSVQATMEADAARFEKMVEDIYNKNL